MKNLVVEKIKDYFQKQPAVSLVYLFGSQVTGEAKEDSDVDLAVLTKAVSPMDFKLRSQIVYDLSNLLNKQIEVQDLGSVDILFAQRVITQGIPIFVSEPELKIFYETYVLRQYFDLKPFYKEYFEDLAKRARQGLIGQVVR